MENARKVENHVKCNGVNVFCKKLFAIFHFLQTFPVVFYIFKKITNYWICWINCYYSWDLHLGSLRYPFTFIHLSVSRTDNVWKFYTKCRVVHMVKMFVKKGENSWYSNIMLVECVFLCELISKIQMDFCIPHADAKKWPQWRRSHLHPTSIIASNDVFMLVVSNHQILDQANDQTGTICYLVDVHIHAERLTHTSLRHFTMIYIHRVFKHFYHTINICLMVFGVL